MSWRRVGRLGKGNIEMFSLVAYFANLFPGKFTGMATKKKILFVYRSGERSFQRWCVAYDSILNYLVI